MLKNIPKIYPEESVYSWLSRIYVRSGFCCFQSFAREIYQKENAYADFTFISELSDTFLTQIKKVISFEELLKNHTLFKYYSLFLPSDKKRTAFEYAMSNKPLLNAFLPIPNNKVRYFLRYCPECVVEDRKQYGEAYFHIQHQIYEANVCHKHNCKLINSDITISKAKDSKLIPLEQVLVGKNIQAEFLDSEDTNVLFSKYINNYLKYPFQIEEFPVGTYLSNKINKRYCISERQEQKNVVLILSEMANLFKGLNGYDITKGRLQTIYRNEYFNVWDIFLVSYFQNETIDNLYTRKSGLISPTKLFDDKVVELYSKYKNYSKIASLMNVNKEIIRQVVLGNYDREKKHSNGGYCKRYNWQQVENECLKKLPDILKKYKGQKITKIIIASELGLKDKTLRNCPKIRQEIKVTNAYLYRNTLIH